MKKNSFALLLCCQFLSLNWRVEKLDNSVLCFRTWPCFSYNTLYLHLYFNFDLKIK